MILDFIAGGVPDNPSGESLGKYNAVIGNANSQDDLSARTIDQICGQGGLMDQLLADGEPSTAVGRYQIIRKTLQTLKKNLNIAGSTRFTPDLQDRLGLALMVGRGYQKWWTGAISDRQFAHNISLEWASLPDPENGGKSHYDGVGPNHASTSLDKVLTMLQKARAEQPQQAAAPAGPAGAAAAPVEGGHLPESMAGESPRDVIKDIQTILQKARFYDGDIDGFFGEQSQAALDSLRNAARH